jgi:hypothetical protein
MEWRSRGCQVAGPYLNWGSVRSEGFVVRRTRERNLIARQQFGALVGAECQTGAGERSDDHDRRTPRRTGVTPATNSIRWAELPTAGVTGDGNGDRPAGHGHGVVFRLIVNPRSGQPASLVVPTPIGREPRSRSFSGTQSSRSLRTSDR